MGHVQSESMVQWHTKRDVAPETCTKLLDMFASGYGSAEAFAVFIAIYSFETTAPSAYSSAFADRAMLPSMTYHYLLA